MEAMCGRYAVTLPPDAMATLFGSADRPNLAPRWNVAPTQLAPMVAIGQAGDTRILQARWGLRPAWMAKDPPTGPLFNARGETLADKPSFRTAFARKRCLIPADGFYEWKRDGKLRTPYFIARPDARTVAFAGLWEAAKDEDGGLLLSMSIVTTAARESFKALHDRFPVVIEPDHWRTWLTASTPPDTLKQLLVPPPDGVMVPRQVSDRVNKVSHDDAECLKPID
jgi:putative SOS response-associated peptidase YedK